MAIHALITMGWRGLTTYLVIAWVGMGGTYLLVRWLAQPWLRWRLRRAYTTSGDIFFDLGRLDAQRPQLFLVERVHRLERAALQLPVLIVSLLAPLTIHLLIALVFLGVRLADFGQWMMTTAVLVGHAHLILALFAIFHVVRVQRELDAGTRVSGGSRGLVALLWTVGASAVPGVVLLCIPPLLVAMTGLLFVPWMFHWVGHTALVERMVLVEQGLEACPPRAPRAPEVVGVCRPAPAPEQPPA